MSNNNCIIPECYIDSCLVEVVLFADRNRVNHTKGNGTVASKMRNFFGGNFCIGIIDEDRKELDYLKEFDLWVENDSLRLLKHVSECHFMIQLRPVVEKWILSNCKESGINIKDYGLPDSLKDLTRITKAVGSKSDARFIQLFKDLKKKQPKPVLQLQYWIEDLKARRFNADINQLRNA